jgi:ABC-2 type transport system ATP-binding protein
MSNVAIDIQQLTRSYGPRRGVSDVNLKVERGALFGFLGPNGAGKTTTIRVLLGFLRPTSGKATALGLDCWRQSHTLKHDVGAIPGDLRLWPWLSGRSALKLFGRIRGKDMLRQGQSLAEELELDLSVKVRAMSRGMRQKLGLILALAHEPKLLILDEPTTALDPLMQDRLREILRRRSNLGDTVFFSSHTLGEVQALCERVAIVKRGVIVADTTVSELAAAAGHDIDIRWSAATPLPESTSLDPIVTWKSRESLAWTGRLREGELPQLLAFVAQNRSAMADLKIARPDLETLFMRFYEDDSNGEAPR